MNDDDDAMDVEVNTEMPDWKDCLGITLDDCCPVCGCPLRQLPFKWIVFPDLYTSPTDWFVHPLCAEGLLNGTFFTRN
jgi:hypothetical protein